MEDLTSQYRRKGARIGLTSGWTKQRREVSGTLRVGGQGVYRRAALIIAVLLPGEEKKGLVTTVIEFGNPHRSPEAPAVIVLMVARLNIRPIGNIVPGDGVQLVVMKVVKSVAMVRISSGLGCKGVDATVITTEFSGDVRADYLD